MRQGICQDSSTLGNSVGPELQKFNHRICLVEDLEMSGLLGLLRTCQWTPISVVVSVMIDRISVVLSIIDCAYLVARIEQ